METTHKILFSSTFTVSDPALHSEPGHAWLSRAAMTVSDKESLQPHHQMRADNNALWKDEPEAGERTIRLSSTTYYSYQSAQNPFITRVLLQLSPETPEAKPRLYFYRGSYELGNAQDYHSAESVSPHFILKIGKLKRPRRAPELRE